MSRVPERDGARRAALIRGLVTRTRWTLVISSVRSSREARRPDQPVAQLLGVAPAHLQHDLAQADAAAPAVDADLVDVPEGHERGAVDPDEAGRAPPLLQRRERHADQVTAGRRVQARVVALR